MNVRCNHGRFSRAWRARGLVRRAPHVAPATVQAASLLSLAMPCTTPAAAGVNAGVTNTLHAHVLADHPHPAGPGPRRRGLFVDCETTGFDHGRDQVIELAMLPFVYTLEGAITDTPAVRIWAVGAPFETKDELRARGYRWMPTERDGAPRSWWTDVAPAELEDEFAWLAGVYRAHGRLLSPNRLPRRDVTARDRWRARAESVAMHDIGETAHAIRRDTRIIDEQLAAVLTLIADLDEVYGWPELKMCRTRIGIATERTRAIRERVESTPPAWIGPPR